MCVCVCVCVCARAHARACVSCPLSCVWFFYNPMDCSPPASSVHRILQARILEWVAISSSRAFPQPRDWTHISCLAGGYFTAETPKKTEFTQLCLTLCDPMDCSLRGSSIHGVFQARVLEWVANSFFVGSSQPRDRTQVSCIASGRFYHLRHQGSSLYIWKLPIG